MKKLVLDPDKIKELAVGIEELATDFTEDDWRMVEQEKQYYRVLMGLRETREQLGLTQAQLAKKSNVPRATISKIESGNRNPTLETLMQLASAMGKQLDIRLV